MELLRFGSWQEVGEKFECTGEHCRLSVECSAAEVWKAVLECGSQSDDGVRLPIDFPAEPVSSFRSVPYLLLSSGEAELHVSPGRGTIRWGNLGLCFHRLTPESPVPLSPRRGSAELNRLPSSALCLSFSDRPTMHYFGLGGRNGGLNKRGGFWEDRNVDDRGTDPQSDPLYQTHPLIFCLDDGEAYAIFANELRRSWFELGKTGDGRSYAMFETNRLELYLIPGPSPEEVLHRYYRLVGAAQLPPLWTFGYHHCRANITSQIEVEQLAVQFRSLGIPLDSLWLDLAGGRDKGSATFAPKRFPSPGKMNARLAEMGIKTIAIVERDDKDKAGEAEEARGSENRDHSDAMRTRALPHKNSRKAKVSRINAMGRQHDRDAEKDVEQVEAWRGKLRSLYPKFGSSGVCPEPDEASRGDGDVTTGEHRASGAVFLNHVAQATYDDLRRLMPEKRPFLLSRLGASGIHRHAWVWTGKNFATWEHLAASLPTLLNLGLSGLPFAGADIGGYHGDTGGELFARWMWLGTFYPLMRNHTAADSARQEPWTYSERDFLAVKKALEFRYQLLPYIYTLAKNAADTGAPLLRPMFFADPADEVLAGIDDQALFGAALLLAPATSPGQRKRVVYLPTGPWQDFWSGARYEGPRWITVDTPLDSIPLFQRGGTAVPLAKPALHTRSANWPEIVWRVVPGETIVGELYEDSGDGYALGRRIELHGICTTSQLLINLLGSDPAGSHQVEVIDENNQRIVTQYTPPTKTEKRPYPAAAPAQAVNT